MQLYGLADCNNFYCSCERVFRPDLREDPVVVLSNNDGCIIARSEESKRLGLKMGTPYYQVRHLLETHHVTVFSSNYTLYGSLSGRVMSLLSRYTPQLEPYSIDEAFLDFSDMGDAAFLKAYGERMAADVRRSVGIPISVGIAPTRTLAKVASKYAKRYAGYRGCCLMDTDDKRRKALSSFDVGDVWGIGRHLAETLAGHDIRLAADLADKDEAWVSRHFNVNVVRTWKELNGISCISPDDSPEKKSICTSRSFADEGVTDLHLLEEYTARFATRCADKLRGQASCCSGITVFAYTSRFRTEQPVHVIHQSTVLPVATNATAEIVGHVLRMLRAGFRTSARYAYKKAGVVLWDICPQNAVQQDLFDVVDRQKQTALQRAVDHINRRNGPDKVHVAVRGFSSDTGARCDRRSPHYTTDVNELPVAFAR